jgi:hypothetical protein
MDALDLAVLAEDVIDVVLLAFFMEPGDDDDPAFDC